MAKNMILQTIQCRCGSRRVRGDSCGDCGFRPKSQEVNEINLFQVRRKRVVSHIDASVEQNLAETESASTYWEMVTTFPENFEVALRSIIGEEPTEVDGDKMIETLVALEHSKRALESIAKLRPRAMERAQLNVLNKLSTWWPIYREAIMGIDPAFIESKTNEGQHAIDTSLEAIHDLWPTLEALELLEDHLAEPSLTKRQLRALRKKYPEYTIRALETLGIQKVFDIMGVECSSSLGLQYLMIEMLAESVFLSEKFHSKIFEVTNHWRENGHRIQEVAAMQRSLSDLSDVSARLTEAFLQFEYSVQTATHGRGLIRAVERLLGNLFEDAQPLWTWNVLLQGESIAAEKYIKTAEENSTEHVKKLARLLPEICEDADKFYRHASHHGRRFSPNPMVKG